MNLFYHEVNWQHFQDCAICCMFYPYDYKQLAGALSAMTGHEYEAQDILDVGERAQQLCRLFNNREGFTEKDDRLPKRVMQAFKSGPLEGVEITEEALHDRSPDLVRPDGLDARRRADQRAARSARFDGAAGNEVEPELTTKTRRHKGHQERRLHRALRVLVPLW